MEQSFKHLQWQPAVAGDDSGRKKLVKGLGKVEEVPRKVPARGIEVWWPEEGDRWERGDDGASARLRSALDEVRRKREMTSGSHAIQLNIWSMPGELSADPARTVREAGVTGRWRRAAP